MTRPATPSPVAEARWDAPRDFAGWEQLALAAAITFEGDMGRASVFYGHESAWAMAHPEDDYRAATALELAEQLAEQLAGE